MNDERQQKLGQSLLGKQVRFNHERDKGALRKVTAVNPDGMVKINDLPGWFGPHLFVVTKEQETKQG